MVMKVYKGLYNMMDILVLGAGSGEEVVGEDASWYRTEAVAIYILVKIFTGGIEDIAMNLVSKNHYYIHIKLFINIEYYTITITIFLITFAGGVEDIDEAG